jgi:hypothetical protein
MKLVSYIEKVSIVYEGSGRWYYEVLALSFFFSKISFVRSSKALDFKQVAKVETPIHDNIRELVTWECKEHGVKS